MTFFRPEAVSEAEDAAQRAYMKHHFPYVVSDDARGERLAAEATVEPDEDAQMAAYMKQHFPFPQP